MSKKKGKAAKAAKDNKPAFPIMAPPAIAAAPFAQKADAKDFMNNIKTFWEKSLDIQKSSMDSAKDQYIKFFDFWMDIQDTFADTLPEEASAIAGLPISVSPKSLMKSFKDFEKLANDFFVEQADTFNEFVIDGQQKAIEVFADMLVEEEAEEEAEAENVEYGE